MTGVGSKSPKLPPKDHDQDLLSRAPTLPPRTNIRMKELQPRLAKNLPPPRPPKLFQKDYLDTENDASFNPSKLSPASIFLLNEDRRVTQPDLPPKSPKSPLNKAATNGPLNVWY